MHPAQIAALRPPHARHPTRYWKPPVEASKKGAKRSRWSTSKPLISPEYLHLSAVSRADRAALGPRERNAQLPAVHSAANVDLNYVDKRA
jgi:hypothetical protein